MVGAKKVIAKIVERARILHEGAVGGAATEPRAGRGALDGVIAGLMVHVRVRGDGERQALRGEPERIEVREDDLFRGLRDARVDQHGVIAHQEILKKVPATKQGLDLINVRIEFHSRLQKENGGNSNTSRELGTGV